MIMSDPVSNLAGSNEPRFGATPAWQNAKAPLSDLFANVLDKANFAEQMLGASQFSLLRVAARVNENHQHSFDTQDDRAPAEPAQESAAPAAEHSEKPEHSASDAHDHETPRPDETDAAQQSAAAALVNPLAAPIAQSKKGEKPGLSVQPNAASGVNLQTKGDGPTPGERRVLITGAADKAAAQSADKGAATAAAAQADQTHGKPKLDPSLAKKSGQETTAAPVKAEAAVQANNGDKSLAARNAATPQAQAPNAAADAFATLSDKHAQQIRASAKRAAELHNMKLQLFAHRDAISKVEAKAAARSENSSVQSQTSGANAVKATIQVTAQATPPAAAALDGPSARPAGSFDGPASGGLAGQNGPKLAVGGLTGDSAGNGLNHASALAERQAAANTPRAAAPALRPTASQLAYQPAEQIKVHIQQMVKSGAERIHVRLSPASLGRVEVALEVHHDKAVHAVVYAEKQETLDMLARDARVLREAFEQAGLRFDSNGLTFRQGHADNPGAGLANTNTGPTGPADTSTDAGEADLSLDPTLPRRRLHNGMLDLEI